MKKGFALIELLVVVLIIGILAAIALPQYQKAVLKSRFSSLMPTTKAIRDGNEIYYMTNNRYAHTIADLEVTTTDTQDMTLEISDNVDYTYTFATRPDLNEKNNLIMYQKHSVQFPGEIHCEAKQDDSQADWLCRSALHAVKELGEVITPGYNTFVLEGTGNGFTPAQLDAMNGPNCDKAREMGYTCTMTENEDGTRTKRFCNVDGLCSVIDYNGNTAIKRVVCLENESGVCVTKIENYYDEEGRLSSVRSCKTTDGTTGECTAYNSYNNYDYEYDENGKMVSSRSCKTINASTGKCATYNSYGNYDYGYDENGNMTSKYSCSGINSTTGKCTGYNSYSSYTYVYDENGNQIAEVGCRSVNVATGNCTSHANWGYTYSYDDQGNQTSRQRCKTINATTGMCSAYDENVAGANYFYTYDENGNKLTAMGCMVDASGKCTRYDAVNSFNYTYDDQGRVTSQKRCATINTSTGQCTSYSRATTEYTYDEGGIRTAHSCSQIDASGNCTSYNNANYVAYDDEGNQIWTGNYCGSHDRVWCMQMGCSSFY